jgi:hypothetical protein
MTSFSVTALGVSQLDVKVLSVARATGSVASSQAGIACGATCTASFPEDQFIVLTASVPPSSVFLGWSGDCSGLTCTLEMSVPRTATALFGPASNLIFVTSAAYSLSDLGGLDGGDLACAAAAADAGLPGTYVAWLSTTATAAASRLGSARGWIRTDGLPFADTLGDLTNGTTRYSPSLDEHGAGARTFVRTGTLADGTLGDNCADFSDPNGACVQGASLGGGAAWTQAGTSMCSGPSAVYCLGIDRAHPVTVTKSASRTAFVSRDGFAPGGGLASADAHCAADAADAGLAKGALAYLQTSTATPLSRFDTTTRPLWARPDGVFLAESFEAFAQGPYSGTLGPVWLGLPVMHADGTFTPAFSPLWGDLVDQKIQPSYTCLDWTSGAVANSGFSCLPDQPACAIPACTGGYRLLCLEP